MWSHLLKKSLMENFGFCAVWFDHKSMAYTDILLKKIETVKSDVFVIIFKNCCHIPLQLLI